MLGSAEGSAALAGKLGSGFVLALFIGTHDRPTAIMDVYRRAFVPSSSHATPQAMIAVAVICAESRDEAERIAGSHTYWKVQAFRHGNRYPLLTPKQALVAYEKLSPEDQAYYHETLDTYVLGTPESCLEQLDDICNRYHVDEIMVVNVTYAFNARKRSYQLLSEAARQEGIMHV
jgi:alkanesulfonate monooxygenase SsuD/methylene tetrahydromethanopterin reductase-like flavin-dependent oxidoreductase (luciferase family)